MPFLNEYDSLVNRFTEAGNFVSIENIGNNRIQWPDSRGVYSIWKNDLENVNNLIYVGLTGRFIRDGGEIIFNGGNFQSRAGRWTPYKFCESEADGNFIYSFRYSPISTNSHEQYNMRYQHNAYEHSIPYNQLIIHCFLINHFEGEYTPAYLEAYILTRYLNETDDLPAANNSL